MTFDPNSNTVAVGLDDGTVVVIRILENMNYIKYEDILDKKLHQTRVMGVAYDHIQGQLYTISEDKYLKIT